MWRGKLSHDGTRPLNALGASMVASGHPARDNSRVRGLLIAVLLFTACGEEPRPDLRFASPQATLQTLFDVYGVLDVPQDEIDRRMEIGYRFHLIDPATLHLCFADWNEPADEGLAGYVFGNLIVAKDDLVATIRGDRAEMLVQDPERRSRPVVFARDAGAWRIVLEESVPRSIQQELRRKWEQRPGG